MPVIVPVILIILLVSAAAILRFCFTAYNFVSYSLVYIAFLIGICFFGSFPLRLVAAVITAAAAIPLILAEICILKEAFRPCEHSSRCVIVLGAAVLGTVPSKALIHRCDAALEYLTLCPEAIAVLSGGKGPGEDISEALAIKTYLTDRGILPERLYLEDRSCSTAANLRNSFQILSALNKDFKSNTAIITSPYHMHRAKLLSSALGVSVKGYTSKPELTLSDINLFIREAFGTLFAIFKIHVIKGDL